MAYAEKPPSVGRYDVKAARLAAAYVAVPPTATRDWLADLLPGPPAPVIS